MGQLFVDSPFQRRGIGTAVMNRLIGEAARVNQPVRLSVVKMNPALRLYERLGFDITHEDDRKFCMKRVAGVSSPTQRKTNRHPEDVPSSAVHARQATSMTQNRRSEGCASAGNASNFVEL
ncbi:MAG: GNAT family N-acetyltransferase [Acidobacteria bacterium Pan2503]|uniref:GNAT family N-acetyltransferase n=1 Tax=Candidatus Acidiferrum panamense TaxID=2741543 RepID=A0A7V8NRL9_9BACT|nr:GNAT family N-acetyltransferase [Candidatus Acidoferrum panamensis]